MGLWNPPKSKYMYSEGLTFSDKQALANSVDPDQTALEGELDQGLHCLLFHMQFLDPLLYST